MSNEIELEKVNKIITGIASRSSYKFKGLDYEDIVQELWLAVLDSNSEHSYKIDYNLVAVICYCKIVDLQRYEMRRNHYSLDDNNMDSCNWQVFENTEIDSQILIDDLYKLFPEDSPEYKYLVYWASYANIYNKEISLPLYGKYKEGYTENGLAQILGYGSSAHRNYKRFREKMQKFIKNYFNLD